MQIKQFTTDAELHAAYRAMAELRPHLDEAQFVEQVKRQMQAHGYRLVGIETEEGVVAAAGYRLAEFLAWGKALYVDDLITHSGARRQGHAGRLLDWLLAEAGRQGCEQFHLDSGTHRHDAHRLYLNKGMQINSFHFARYVANDKG